jgi:hypothetical protein
MVCMHTTQRADMAMHTTHDAAPGSGSGPQAHSMATARRTTHYGRTRIVTCIGTTRARQIHIVA